MLISAFELRMELFDIESYFDILLFGIKILSGKGFEFTCTKYDLNRNNIIMKR